MKTVIKTIFKKEIKETLFAMKGIIWFFITAVLFSVLCLAVVSVKELSLMAQTEVIMTFSKLALGVGAAISMVLSAVSFSHEREADTLESLLLTPVSKFQLLAGKLSAALVLAIGAFFIAVPYLFALCYKTGTVSMAIGLLFLMGFIAALAFSMIGSGISILTGNSKTAIITTIIVLVITAIPSFLTTTTKKAGFAFVLNKISPVSSTFNLMKEVIINKRGFETITPMLISVFVFFCLAAVFLVYCARHMSYKGGE